MRKQKNKLLYVLILSLAISLLAACGQSGSGGEPSSPAGNSNEQGGNKDSNEKPTKLSIFIPSRSSDAMYTMETAVWKELGKRLNIEFEFTTGESREMGEKFKLMIASGKYPDIVSGSVADLNKYGMDGVFIPLDDLIQQKAPEIQKHLIDDVSKKMQAVAVDGSIYSVPMQTAIRTAEGYVVRKDWLDRVGLGIPETIVDWYNMLKAFKEQDANGNGDPNDEIPLMTDYIYYTNFAEAWGIDVNPWGPRWQIENGELMLGAIDERAKEYMATLNQWYAEGLLDKEFLSRTDQDLENAIISNKLGAGQHWVGYLVGFNNNKEAEQFPGFEYEVAPPPVLNKGEQPRTFRQQASLHPSGWGISKSNKHIDKTIELFDYAYSDEGQLLLNFGIEGDTFVREGDDVKYTDKVLNSPEGKARELWRIGAQPIIGFRQDPRYERATPNEETERRLFEYVEKDYFFEPFPPLKYTDDEHETLVDITTPMYTYIDEMMTNFIIGKEPLGKFDEFVAKVKSMRYDELLQIQQTAYNRYQELASR